MILVAIVEDDYMIRKALQEYLEMQDDMKCIYAAGSMESFFRNLDENNLPDVVLIDIGLPGISGISGLKIIGEKYPEINCIVLTVYQDTHKIFQSLRAGASAYLLKNVPFKEIGEVINMVHKGGSFMSPPIARKVIEYFQDTRRHPVKTPVLTDKEKEIVMGLVDGMTYNKIAEKSFISVETVRSHIKNIYKKLHVHSKAEVIKKSLNGEI